MYTKSSIAKSETIEVRIYHYITSLSSVRLSISYVVQKRNDPASVKQSSSYYITSNLLPVTYQLLIRRAYTLARNIWSAKFWQRGTKSLLDLDTSKKHGFCQNTMDHTISDNSPITISPCWRWGPSPTRVCVHAKLYSPSSGPCLILPNCPRRVVSSLLTCIVPRDLPMRW